jgi:hypothetical protein
VPDPVIIILPRQKEIYLQAVISAMISRMETDPPDRNKKARVKSVEELLDKFINPAVNQA